MIVKVLLILLAVFFPVVFIIISFLKLFKKNAVKVRMFSLLILFSFYVLLEFRIVNEYFFPICQVYGREINKNRQKLLIPLIQDNWNYQYEWGSKQYRKWFSERPLEIERGHAKKKVILNWLGIKEESDYFNIEGNRFFLLHTYDYGSKERSFQLVEKLSSAENLVNGGVGFRKLYTKDLSEMRFIELFQKYFDKPPDWLLPAQAVDGTPP